MTIAMSLMAIVACLAKILSGRMPVSTILFFQYLFMSLYIVLIRRPDMISLKSLAIVMLRAIFTLVSAYCIYIALAETHVTLVLAIFYTYPVFIILLFISIYKIRITPIESLCIVGAFLSVLLILRPGSISQTSTLLALIAAFCVGLRTVLDRLLLVNSYHPYCIQFYAYSASTIVLLLLMSTRDSQDTLEIFEAGGSLSMNMILISVIAISIVTAQVLMMTVLKVGKITTYSILSYWEVLASIPIGYMIFKVPIGGLEIFGILLLLVMGIAPHFSRDHVFVPHRAE
jgi:drug/metabolite transporter (DMT)-like permease